MEHEKDDDTNCSWCTYNVPQRLGKKTWKIENQRKNGYYLEHNIVKISLNNEKRPADLKWLAVTQTLLKDYRLRRRAHEKTWSWLRKGNSRREREFFLIAAQNNAVKTHHIKARIDKTQQNSKCRLCGDRDETINHIISECSKLAQKEYKTRHDWVGKVIHWEMCKKSKFNHTNKWYMHNPASVLENDTNSYGTLTYTRIT